MSDQGRTKVLAGVLALVAVFFLWRQFGGSDGSSDAVARAASQNARGRRAATASRAPGALGAPGEVIPLELERLEHRPAEYSPGRDLFQYHRPAPAVAKPPPKPPPTKPQADRASRRPRKPPRPKPPPFDLDFLGSFGPDGRKIAVFSDEKDILNALEGDVLNDKFVVGPIGYESVEMGFVGFPDEPPKRIGVDG